MVPLADVSARSGSNDGHDGHVRDFLALCLVEARRYGDDDTIWVRELVQNARDAGARRIRFRRDGDDVVVDDDGSGMSREVVAAQLLRLFSSRKAANGQAAGCFGVGFWSVLRASPTRIEVDTHDGTSALSAVIDVEGGVIAEVPSRRQRRGTTVRLVGARHGAGPLGDGSLRRAIVRHASMVQGLTGMPPALVLATDTGDVILNRPFSIEGEEGVVATATVVGPGFSGMIGLSANPRVEIFHHGLRVVEATSLSALVPSLRHRPRRGLGLVVRVDVPGVSVLVDRRTVVEDDTIKAVVAACDDGARTLERRVLDAAAPLPRIARARQAVQRWLTGRTGRGLGLAMAAILGGLVLGVVVVRAVGGPAASTFGALPWPGLSSTTNSTIMTSRTSPTNAGPVPRSVSDAIARLGPPRIDVRGSDVTGFAIATRNISDDLVIDVRSLPDDVDGLRPTSSRRSAIPSPPAEGPIVASAQLRASGTTVLPSSQLLWPVRASVGDHALRIWLTADGLPQVHLDEVPLDDVPHDATTQREQVVDVFFVVASDAPWAPGTTVIDDPALVPIVDTARGLTGRPAIEAVATAVADRVHYAATADDASRFAADPRPFVARALGLGIGDCDVINTVVVRALQQAGFQARLARGFVVRNDVVATELHAWAEVRSEGRWLTVDASPLFAVPTPGAPAPSTSTSGSPNPTPAATATSSTSTTPTSTGTSSTRSMPPAVRPPTAMLATAPLARPASGFAALPAEVVVGLLAGLLLMAAAVVVVVVGRRRQSHEPAHHVERDVMDLFVAGLRSGAADSLGLLERQIVPTSHGDISLAEARRLAHGGRLARGKADVRLSSSVRFLDDTHPRVRALQAFLPACPPVDVWDEAPLPAHLMPLQRRLDEAFRSVALRSGSTPGLTEILLHTRDGKRHQLLVGPDLRALPTDELWRRLQREASTLWHLRQATGPTP